MPIQRECPILHKHGKGNTVFLTLAVGDMVRQTCRAPGQFVHIRCGDGLLLRRPLSVCSCRTGSVEDTLELVFEIRGKGTRWLAERHVGDKLDVLGFLGNGFSIPQEGRCLLIGGGIGTPPLLGCAEHLKERAVAILGFRSAERAILLSRFQETGVAVLTATDDGSLGFHGTVVPLMRQELDKAAYSCVLACGPRPMLQSVARTAAEYSVACQVSLEERMACGVGACLGCAAAMADGSVQHVCKDGPVFSAEEVNWDAV